VAVTLAKEASSGVVVVANNKVSDLLSFVEGTSSFLESIHTTFRLDKVNKRPKINKLDSIMDKNQKREKKYFKMN